MNDLFDQTSLDCALLSPCEGQQSTLYVAPASEQVANRLERACRQRGLLFGEWRTGVYTVDFDSRDLGTLCLALTDCLSPEERESTRYRMANCGTEPPIADLMRADSVEHLIVRERSQWLVDVIRSERLVTYFQPIVHACQPFRVFGYECLLRGRDRDGKLIPAPKLFGAARDTGLMVALDDAARLTAIDTFAERQGHGDTRVFININPRSIKDPERCLDSTIRAALRSGIPMDRFVFEVVESDEILDVPGLMRVLDFCRDIGCQVALDDLGAGYSSLKLLSEIKPDFVKLEMDLIRNVERDVFKSRVASKIIELARELSVPTIVEGVETVDQWDWAVQHGAEYVQGFFFAKPAAEPPCPTIEAVAPSLEGSNLVSKQGS